MAWHGYQLKGSEAADHTVVTSTTETQNDGDSGTAAALQDGNWGSVGWVAGGGGVPWTKFDFGSPQALAAFKWKANAAVAILDGSDNDSDWTNIPLVAGVAPIAGIASEGVYVFASTETYRYWRFKTNYWKNVYEVEFYSVYNPAELRFWGPNPYLGRTADGVFAGDGGTTYYNADGGGSHYIGWEFTTTQLIGNFQITTGTNMTQNLEWSDNDGADWTVAQSMTLVADTPKEIVPTDNDHKAWRIPITNWHIVNEIVITFGSLKSAQNRLGQMGMELRSGV